MKIILLNALYFFLLFYSSWALTDDTCQLVESTEQLLLAVKQHTTEPSISICLAEGVYQLEQTLAITRPHLSIYSLSNDPTKVILQGRGMRANKGVDNLIWVGASHFRIKGVTLRAVGNHLIQVSGAHDADFFSMSDCILQDAYQQLFKVSKDPQGKVSADYGVIERTIFEYTQGIGPNWYIGGVDVHTGQHWIVKDNAFFNIASGIKHIAEPAIHFWSKAKDTKVIGNLVVDSDRGIGFGMAKSKHYGGEISNNFVYHRAYTFEQRPFADVGIILESATNAIVQSNIVYLESGYPNAIEYRYPSLDENLITHNLTNKKIRQRDFGRAKRVANQQVDDQAFFKSKLNKYIQLHPLESLITKRLQIQ